MLENERGNTRSHSMKNSNLNILWNRSTRDYGVVLMTKLKMKIMRVWNLHIVMHMQPGYIFCEFVMIC